MLLLKKWSMKIMQIEGSKNLTENWCLIYTDTRKTTSRGCGNARWRHRSRRWVSMHFTAIRFILRLYKSLLVTIIISYYHCQWKSDLYRNMTFWRWVLKVFKGQENLLLKNLQVKNPRRKRPIFFMENIFCRKVWYSKHQRNGF